jgi:hypothetical protein
MNCKYANRVCGLHFQNKSFFLRHFLTFLFAVFHLGFERFNVSAFLESALLAGRGWSWWLFSSLRDGVVSLLLALLSAGLMLFVLLRFFLFLVFLRLLAVLALVLTRARFSRDINVLAVDRMIRVTVLLSEAFITLLVVFIFTGVRGNELL